MPRRPKPTPLAHGISPALRAALYARVSTEEQAEEGHSIDAQLRVMREYCQRRGWRIVGEYVDAGHSGKTLRRPDMQRLLRDAHHAPPPFDVIVVHKLDRFSRSLVDTLTSLRDLNDCGISLASATQPVDYTTPEGKLMLMMLSLFAEIYIDNLSAETKKGKEERARKGLYNGTLPFGYMPRVKHPVTDDDKVPVLHPENVEGYRLAVRMCADGKPAREIIAALNAKGYRTTGNWGARPFGKDTLLPMLKSQFYLGKVYYKGEWLPGRHAPAIDRATWERAQQQIARRAANKLDHHAKNTRVYPLRQLLYCAECGNRLRGWGNESGTRFYRDPAKDKGHPCRQPAYINARVLEAQIGDLLARVQLPEDWQRQVLDMLRDAENDGENERRARERQNLEGQRERLKVLFQLGDIGEADYRQERARLQDRIAELTPTRSGDEIDHEAAARLLSNVAALWERATDAEREEMTHALFEKIYVREKRIAAVEPRNEFYPLLAVACGMDASEGNTRMPIANPSLPFK